MQISDSIVTAREMRGLSAVSSGTVDIYTYPMDRSKRVIHKLLLYGADCNYKSQVTNDTCWKYLDNMEDEDLKNQCQDLLQNIGVGMRKGQGLLGIKGGNVLDSLCCGVKKSKSDDTRRDRRMVKLVNHKGQMLSFLFQILLFLLVAQFAIFILYIFPSIKTNTISLCGSRGPWDRRSQGSISPDLTIYPPPLNQQDSNNNEMDQLRLQLKWQRSSLHRASIWGTSRYYFVCAYSFAGTGFSNIVLNVVFILQSVILLGLFGYLVNGNPGYLIRYNDEDYDELVYKVNFSQICGDCHLMMTERSRHCFICRRCVDNYDHHCEWLNQCIGSANAKPFLTFVVCLWFQMLFVLVISIDQIVLFILGERENPEDDPFSILPAYLYNVYLGLTLSLIIAVLCAIFIYPMTKLMILHFRNHSQGITTFQRYHCHDHRKDVTTDSHLDDTHDKYHPLLLKGENNMLQSKNTMDEEVRDKLMSESQQAAVKIHTTPNTAGERQYEGNNQLQISKVKCPNSSLQVSDSIKIYNEYQMEHQISKIKSSNFS